MPKNPHQFLRFPVAKHSLDAALDTCREQGLRVVDFWRDGEFWIVKLMA